MATKTAKQANQKLINLLLAEQQKAMADKELVDAVMTITDALGAHLSRTAVYEFAQAIVRMQRELKDAKARIFELERKAAK